MMVPPNLTESVGDIESDEKVLLAIDEIRDQRFATCKFFCAC